MQPGQSPPAQQASPEEPELTELRNTSEKPSNSELLGRRNSEKLFVTVGHGGGDSSPFVATESDEPGHNVQTFLVIYALLIYYCSTTPTENISTFFTKAANHFNRTTNEIGEQPANAGKVPREPHSDTRSPTYNNKSLKKHIQDHLKRLATVETSTAITKKINLIKESLGQAQATELTTHQLIKDFKQVYFLHTKPRKQSTSTSPRKSNRVLMVRELKQLTVEQEFEQLLNALIVSVKSGQYQAASASEGSCIDFTNQFKKQPAAIKLVNLITQNDEASIEFIKKHKRNIAVAELIYKIKSWLFTIFGLPIIFVLMSYTLTTLVGFNDIKQEHGPNKSRDIALDVLALAPSILINGYILFPLSLSTLVEDFAFWYYDTFLSENATTATLMDYCRQQLTGAAKTITILTKNLIYILFTITAALIVAPEVETLLKSPKILDIGNTAFKFLVKYFNSACLGILRVIVIVRSCNMKTLNGPPKEIKKLYMQSKYLMLAICFLSLLSCSYYSICKLSKTAYIINLLTDELGLSGVYKNVVDNTLYWLSAIAQQLFYGDWSLKILKMLTITYNKTMITTAALASLASAASAFAVASNNKSENITIQPFDLFNQISGLRENNLPDIGFGLAGTFLNLYAALCLLACARALFCDKMSAKQQFFVTLFGPSRITHALGIETLLDSRAAEQASVAQSLQDLKSQPETPTRAQSSLITPLPEGESPPDLEDQAGSGALATPVPSRRQNTQQTTRCSCLGRLSACWDNKKDRGQTDTGLSERLLPSRSSGFSKVHDRTI